MCVSVCVCERERHLGGGVAEALGKVEAPREGLQRLLVVPLGVVHLAQLFRV